MSRNFELLQRAEKEREHKFHGGNGQGKRPASLRSLPADLEEPVAALRRRGAPGQKKSDPNSEVSKLVDTVFFDMEPLAPHAVAFADVDFSSARHSVGARAGELLASRVPGPVCLLDANLAAPSLHEYFRVENHFGWTEALQQARPIQDFLRSTEGSNLSILTSGTVEDGWQDLLEEEEVAARMRELREEFDYVLVLCPPVSFAPQAQILGRHADGMILVVEANSTRRDRALELKAELEEADVRLIGTVLNNRTFPIPDAVYSRLDGLLRR